MPAKPTAKPYYLQRAHIRDFRSIRDAVVTFKPGLNIMIGPNGAGKTNFVQALEHGLRKLRPDFRGELKLTLAGRVPLEVSYPDEPVGLAGQLATMGLIGNSAQRIKLTADGHSVAAEHIDVASLNLGVALNSSDDNRFFPRLVVVSHGLPSAYPLVATTGDFTIYTQGVAWNSERQSAFSNALNSGIAGALGEAGVSVGGQRLLFHPEVQEALAKAEEFFLDELRPKLRRFTPLEDVRFAATYQVHTNSTQRQVSIKGLGCEFKVNGDWLSFDQLSSGTQRLFYIVSELVTAFLEYPRAEFPPVYQVDKIILLEEPELGIHPDQLFLLTSFLREYSERHQLIITTHSPQVLDMLNDDEMDRIILCELDPKKGTQFRRLSKKRQETALRYMKEVGFLSDFWRYGSLEGKD